MRRLITTTIMINALRLNKYKSVTTSISTKCGKLPKPKLVIESLGNLDLILFN
jgi:hypothetical protein